MDVVYLALLVVLVGSTSAYLWLCSQLEENGDRFPRRRTRARRAGRRPLLPLHPSQDPPMNPLYIVAALIAFALAIYLVFALLKPEWFE